MASLNHVCMWSEHGWVRVTAEEAARKHPGGTVSVHSGLFMCELCGQYVTLTNGDTRVRYFKHSAYEANKNCPERTFGPSYVPPEYNPGEHELPIRIVIKGNAFSLELGLLYVDADILRKQTEKKVTIATSAGKKFVYSFERLNSDTITYLSIGNEPSAQYVITSTDELLKFWPRTVKGINSRGSVFEKKTGKMLPIDADVQIGKKYLLLTSSRYTQHRLREGLQISKICENRVGWTTWYVYEIEATELSEYAAKFFLDIHCRLTDIPVRMTPIWPLHIETPYVIKHSKNDMIMHVSGNRGTTPKTFPHAYVQTRKCPNTGQVIKIACNGRQQLISTGSANVLQYMYLWREPLTYQTDEVDVDVKDAAETVLSGETQKVLPDGNLLRIFTPFDGAVVIRDAERFILTKIPISANTKTTVPEIKYGTIIQVLQGLDIVWEASFAKQQNRASDEDDALVKKLSANKGDQIPVKHSLSGAVAKLENYPKTKQWLTKTIRSGYISAKSLKYLSKYIADTAETRKGDAK